MLKNRGRYGVVPPNMPTVGARKRFSFGPQLWSRAYAGVSDSRIRSLAEKLLMKGTRQEQVGEVFAEKCMSA